MHFAGVDIPNELVSAALNGDLIILAGAGVSRQPPVKFPLFDALVEQIKERVDPAGSIAARVSRPKEDGSPEYTEAPEHYLGRLSDSGKDVHLACSQVLGTKNVTTELHKNILRLFADDAYIRVITTNFDNCFETALRELNMNPRRYVAPALPLGRSFTGVVYLHGKVDDVYSQVLTSADYGAAYITDSWAARFLMDAFSSHYVLLVGYSCNDTTVDYLTRALARTTNTHAYVLSYSASGGTRRDEWAGRGITPISYNDYDILPELFAQWADYNVLSIYERSLRIQQIAEIPGEPDDSSSEFLDAALNDANADRRLACLRQWYAYAKDSAKLSWAWGHGLLTCLFNDARDEDSTLLREWAVTTFVAQGREVLSSLLFGQDQKPFSGTTIDLLLWRLCSDAVDDEGIVFWLPVIDQARQMNVYRFVLLFEKAESQELKLRLVKAVFRIRTTIKSHLFLHDDVSLAPCIHCQDARMLEKCYDSIRNDLTTIGLRTLIFCLDQLEEAYAVQQRIIQTDTLDVASFMRRSIQPVDAARSRNDNDIDLLIDFAAKVAEGLHQEGIPLDGCAQVCLSSSNKLVYRFGLFLLRLCAKAPEHVIQFVVDNDLLKDPESKNEVFELLASSFPHLDSQFQHEFVQYVTAQVWDKSDPDEAYSAFNLFCWLRRYAPDSDPLVCAIDSVLASYPHYLERDYPQFNWNSTSAHWVDSSLGIDSFNTQTLRDLFETGTESIRLQSILWDSTAKYPLQAYEILAEMFEEGLEDEAVVFISQNIMPRLDWRSIATERGDDVIKLLLMLLGNESLRRDAVFALSQIYRERPSENLVSIWKGVATKAIEALDWARSEESSVAPHDSNPDWLLMGINHPAGRIIEIIEAYTFNAYAQNNSKERKLPERLINSLTDVLNACDYTAGGIRASLFSALHLWYEVVPDIVLERLFPFLTKGGAVMQSCFDGLSYSRITPNLGTALMPVVSEAISQGMVEHLNERGIAFVVRMVITFQHDSVKPSELLSIARNTKDGLSCCLHLTHALMSKGAEHFAALWDAWLGVYLAEQRNLNDRANYEVTRLLLEMVDLMPELSTKVATLLGDGHSVIGPNDYPLVEQGTVELLLKNAEDAQLTNLILLLLKNEELRAWVFELLPTLLPERVAGLQEADISRIRDACSSAGRPYAVDWNVLASDGY